MPKASWSHESKSEMPSSVPPEPDTSGLEHCYDFPEMVVHKGDKSCGRYQTGGICRPMPEPVKPYTDDEQIAVSAMEWFRNILFNLANGNLEYLEYVKDVGFWYPEGHTLYPPSQTSKEQ